MSPYEPTVIATYGSWELVEGFSGRSLRRRRPRGLAKPHLVMGALTIGFAAYMYQSGELPERPAGIVAGFGALILFLGARFADRRGNELRLGATELTMAQPGEVTGTRWPHTELSHIQIFEPLKNLPPAVARRRRARYQVSIFMKGGGTLPIGFMLFDPRSATELARRLSDTTGLPIKTDTREPE